ncbi:MAG: ketoacyl-ACP synthase III [Thermoflexales bacterium]|nr:ketoacyl-ACP synthase III [Thermoflexales bacterium]
MKYGRIAGWGKYVPAKVLTNFDLEKMVDTNDEWIVTRTGIRQRRIAGEGETTTTMSTEAARAALERAGVGPQDVDLIILASSSPDYFLPPASSMVQEALGARCGAFSLAAGCTGFVYGLITAQAFIASEMYRNILVIGAETISRNVDWTDRETCVLFGDGAGAVLVQACDTPSGVLSSVLGSDGSGSQYLIVPGIGCRIPITHETIDQKLHTIRMDGRKVFKFATRTMAQSAAEAIAQAGMSVSDIDLLIPHQANLRIIELAARQLNLSMDKVFVNLEKYGNTSAASVPLAWCEAIEQGRCKPGDNVCLVGFGAGLTWAAAVVRMGETERPFAVDAASFLNGALWGVPLQRFRTRAEVAVRTAQTNLSMQAQGTFHSARKAASKQAEKVMRTAKDVASMAVVPLYGRSDKHYPNDKGH